MPLQNAMLLFEAIGPMSHVAEVIELKIVSTTGVENAVNEVVVRAPDLTATGR